MSAAFDRFVELLEVAGRKVIRRPGKLDFCCPLHDDRAPSAGAAVGDTVPVVAYCQACGESADLPAMLDALGASDADRELILGHGQKANRYEPGQVVHHVYTDATGRPVLRVSRRLDATGKTRKKPDGKKDVWRELFQGGEWKWPKAVPKSLSPDLRGLIYNLPAVLNAAHEGGTAHVGEGERVCDALTELGFVATCNAGGAGKWKLEHAQHLRGAPKVVVWADAGAPGETHVQRVAETLAAVGVAEIRIVRFDGRPDNYDVVDWIRDERARGLSDELIAEMARGIVEAAPVRGPSKEASAPEIVSAAPRDGVPAETNLRFQTAAEMCAAAPVEVPWVVPGYIPQGGMAELDGKVKCGKTTLIARLVREVLDGGTFLGTQVTKGNVVWLTEQPTTSFVDALRYAGLEGRDDLHLLQWHDTRGVSWETVVEAARARVAETESILLVVDTLGQFAGLHGDAENSAGDAQRALRPLQMATGEGLAVLVARHERKSGGEIGDSARGSSAFTGGVDVVMVLRRPEGAQRDTVRVLSAIGRFRETPAEQVIELKDGAYVSLGTALDVAADEARKKVLGECPQDPKEALKLAELVERLGLKRTTCQDAVDSLVKDGLLAKVGLGKRGDPLRYYRLGNGFCQNSIPTETVPAETIPTPSKLSAETPAGSGRMNPEDTGLREVEIFEALGGDQ
jgi:hypothetical protein